MLQQAGVAEVLAGEAKRGQSRRRWLIGAAVAGGLALIGGGWLWWAAASRAPIESYASEAAAKGDIHVTLVATGTLQATQQVSVSSAVSGTIDTVDVDYNQDVAKGQALAHLDMRDLEVQLARARAMAEVQKASGLTAEANLADANAALARAEKLIDSDGVSQREVDLARTAVRRAAAALAAAAAQSMAAEADLRSAQNDYDRGVIVSPIDGVVLDIGVVPGQATGTASLATALFTVAANLRQLDLEVDVDEADVARVNEGDLASFTVEAAPDRPSSGKIRQVRSAPSMSDGVVSYKALISVDNADLRLKPGMTATADISVDDAVGALTVPNAALRYSPTVASVPGPFGAMIPKSTIELTGEEQTVWVLAEGKPKAVAVTVGLTDGQRTEVTGGELHEGDLVITGSKAR